MSIAKLQDLAQEHALLLAWAFGLSTALLVVSIVLGPVIIVRMRADYFTRDTLPDDSFRMRHTATRLVLKVLKNGLGVLLLFAGLAMLVLPGQGLLTLLAAFALLDFPGKRSIQLRIARQRHMCRTLQWVRRRAGQPPLEGL